MVRYQTDCREIAELRLEYPDSSLQELGKMLDNPISKSGVNHRLKKLSNIANELRQEKRVSVERLNPMSDKRRNNMITKKIQIQLQNGLEARPVAVLVQVASQYNSSIYVECDDRKVNAKSIMGMMTLGLTAGEEVVVSANGDDEQTAMDDIVKYLSTANA